MQTANQTERKIPKPLEPNHKPSGEIKSFTPNSYEKLGRWSKELETLAQENSRFFSLQAGQEVQVTFDIEDEDNQMIEKTFKNKDGKEVTKSCRQFVLEYDGHRKLWAPSPTWGAKAISAMEHYGPQLLIKRKGSGLDTEYEFWDTPVPAFKMGG